MHHAVELLLMHLIVAGERRRRLSRRFRVGRLCLWCSASTRRRQAGVVALLFWIESMSEDNAAPPLPALIDALRVWLPVREQLSLRLKNELDAGTGALKEKVPKLKSDGVQVLWPNASHALTQGYLKKKRDLQEPEASALNSADALEYLPHLESHIRGARSEWLADVLWASACLIRDEAANAALVRLIETEVRHNVNTRSQQRFASEAIDDLISHLWGPSDRGLNLGCPRLLSFSGASSLQTWLVTIARNRAIDGGRNRHGSLMSELPTPIDTADRAEASPTESSELFNRIRRCAPRVLKDLQHELKAANAFAQLRYLWLILSGRHDASWIATTLNVNAPRVTQISQQITKRFLDILFRHCPEFTTLGESPDRHEDVTRAQRLAVEEVMRAAAGRAFDLASDENAPQEGAD